MFITNIKTYKHVLVKIPYLFITLILAGICGNERTRQLLVLTVQQIVQLAMHALWAGRHASAAGSRLLAALPPVRAKDSILGHGGVQWRHSHDFPHVGGRRHLGFLKKPVSEFFYFFVQNRFQNLLSLFCNLEFFKKLVNLRMP